VVENRVPQGNSNILTSNRFVPYNVVVVQKYHSGIKSHDYIVAIVIPLLVVCKT